MPVHSDNSPDGVSLLRVLLKGLLLFVLINVLFAFGDPSSSIARLSAYNLIFPGRVRLPYGENPSQAYNFSLYNLDAMFLSHELSARTQPIDEFKVLLIGDSSVWGYLLDPGQTLSAYINSANPELSDGRHVRAYNLGYPTMSLAKDFMMLEAGLRYQPDMVIWLITLESFPQSKQLDSPILQNNPSLVQALIQKYSLNLDPSDERFITGNFLSSTLVGQRRALADVLRLQLYGIMWAATGIDQYYPPSYDPPQEDLDNDLTFHGFSPPQLSPADLSFDILAAGSAISGDIPLMLVNEPIYLSHGINSEVRYNFFYPRWAYDQFRQLLVDFCDYNELVCLDTWNIVPPHEFTNSAIHMTPSGTSQLAARIIEAIKLLPSP